MREVSRCHLGLCLRRADEVSRDAFPIKVWEYIGLKIPSLVTPECEAGDFVEKHRCGMQFSAGDTQSMLTTILTLREQPGRLAAMSAACERAGRGFTRERIGENLARAIVAALCN